MKKFISFILFVFAGAVLIAQGPASAIASATGGTDYSYGAGTASITLPNNIPQEYDYSYQIIPALYGAGDSVNAAVALWQSNSYAGTAWTEITSARDTITATTGVLIEGTDAKGLRHKLIMTGISADTVSYTVYYVYKLDRQFQ